MQCNFTVPRNVAAVGARAYVTRPNPGSANERVEVLVKSRGGRWIQIWENIRYLENFRAKTLPLGHPLYRNEQIWDYDATVLAERLVEARWREVGQ